VEESPDASDPDDSDYTDEENEEPESEEPDPTHGLDSEEEESEEEELAASEEKGSVDSKATPITAPPAPEPETKAKRDLRELATKVDHLSTRLPKNPYCLACQESKMKQKYAHLGAFQRDLTVWGDIVTCDHLVSPSL
jgi:hypothetical protein